MDSHDSSYIADSRIRVRFLGSLLCSPLDSLLDSTLDSLLDSLLGGIVMLGFGVDSERSYLADAEGSLSQPEGCTVSDMSYYCCFDNVGLNYFDCCYWYCYYFDLEWHYSPLLRPNR